MFAHVLDTHYGAPNINYKGKSYSFDWEVNRKWAIVFHVVLSSFV